MASKITKAAVKTTLKSSIESSIKKAFGADHAIHIKESGPAWVNSPRPQAGDDVTNPVVNPVISTDITISVKRKK